MIEVRMELDEWQRVLAILAQAPWSAANPLIMAIGEQLRKANDKGDGSIQQGARRGDGATAPQ